jgi:hypothetical protein
VTNIILPAVVYGYDKCSLTLREEYRLKVFGNKILRRIFEPKEGGSNRKLEKVV